MHRKFLQKFNSLVSTSLHVWLPEHLPYRISFTKVIIIMSIRMHTFNYPFRATRRRARDHFARTHPRTRGRTCNLVCVFPMDTVGHGPGDSAKMITRYRRLTMSQEEFRVRISILHPVTTPWNSPKGVSRINARLSYWAINGPTLTLHRATGNAVHGPWNLWSSPRALARM